MNSWSHSRRYPLKAERDHRSIRWRFS